MRVFFPVRNVFENKKNKLSVGSLTNIKISCTLLIKIIYSKANKHMQYVHCTAIKTIPYKTFSCDYFIDYYS